MQKYRGCKNRFTIAIIIFSLILVFFWFNAINIADWFNGTTYLNHYKDLSQIGDIFGVATSLFTVISIMLILISIQIQSTDLKETRNEFVLQRISELIFNQIEYIDKTMMKLKYHHISIKFSNSDNIRIPMDLFNYNNYSTEIQGTYGIEGIYKFIDNYSSSTYPFAIETISFDKNKRINIDCFNYNIASSSILMESIICSIEIVKTMITSKNLTSQRVDIIRIFNTNIGKEIFNYIEIIGYICKKIKNSEVDASIPLHNTDKESANKLYEQFVKYKKELVYIDVK